MNRIYILAHILFLSSALAAETHQNAYTGLLNDLDAINEKALLKAPVPQCVQSLVYAEPVLKKTSSPLFNACATDLCGPVSKNKSVWITDLNFTSKTSPKIIAQVEKLEPQIGKVFDMAVKLKKAELDELKKYVLNKSQKDFKAMPLDKKAELDELLFGPYLEMQTDLKAPLKQRLKYKVIPPSDTSPEMIQAITAYAENLKRASLINPLKFSYFKVYNEQDIAELAKSSFEDLKKIIEKNKPSLKPEVLEKFNHLEETLKKNSLLQFGLAVMEIDELNLLLADALGKAPLATPTCDDPFCYKAMENYLKDPVLKNNLASYEKLLADPETKRHAMNRCKAGLIVAASQYSNAKDAQKVFLSAKESITKKVIPRFSEHSGKIMLDYLNTKLEMNNKNIRSSGSEAPLKRFEEDARDFLEGEMLSDKTDDITSWQKFLVLKNSFDEIDPLDGTLPCGMQNTPSNAWDSFLPLELAKKYASEDIAKVLGDNRRSDRVFVSDFSCQNQDHGKHNVAHEISHALNYLFASVKLSSTSAEVYKNIRQCAVSNYPGAPSALLFTSHEGDVLYTEEDTADLFAFISNVGDKKIYSSELLRPSLSNDAYADLDFLPPGEDMHSTGLVRVLFEAVNKDIKLPDSCKKLIEQESPKVRFNKCI